MSPQLRLQDVRRAWEARDPELVRLILALAEQPDEQPETPVREGAPTFQKLLSEIRQPAFRHKPVAEQAHHRQERIKALEAPDAEVPLPDRLRLHEIIYQLWQTDEAFARACLLRVIAGVRLTYGPWRALKRIFKEAEARGDTEVLGALSARFDAAYARNDHAVSRDTLRYLCRRSWRYLRRLAATLPVCYADAAVDFLAGYADETYWLRTWVANHIFYHENGEYNRNRFTFRTLPGSLQKFRAFSDLWRRTPRPLFALLERAHSDKVREFAAGALKNDFRAALREVEPDWVARLVAVDSRAIDEFVVWILQNVPRFEQAAFRSLGLHDAVLRLFDSPAPDARAYAAEYARTHARDLPVETLVRLANNDNDKVRRLAHDLLRERDPRKDVGLDAWGLLLETRHGHELAAAIIRKHFGARELTPEWFQTRLFSASPFAFAFAKTTLPQVHPYQKLGPGFFVELLEKLMASANAAPDSSVAGYALTELARFDVNTLDTDFLRRLLLHPATRGPTLMWIDEGRLKAQTLPIDYFKALAYHPNWETDPWLTDLRRTHAWAAALEFDEGLSDRVLVWMKDVRRFAPADVGFAWLMQLVARGEPRYHDFAVEVMSKAFVPADFAPRDVPSAAPQAAAADVDLGGASFLFTGKLATMQRKEAEDKVRAARGSVASGVSAKLHYLVIGDEGSPLYGQGKKGSKQVKAEELNTAGSNIRIISETAFLQMLTGRQQTHTADATLAGCERLWQMALAPGAADAPVARFATRYIRRHHPDIALEETERPVDPGAEIPPEFLTFERVQPLFFESRKHLRDFALELARWEFARWAPPVEAIIRLSESPYEEVRAFVAKALLADDAPEHRRYRIDPAVLTPAAVYSFCESSDEATRLLGMQLIRREPRLQLPEELFRLTESPDRKVRGFVIRALWALYRDRGITADWKPYLPPQPTVGAAAKKAAAPDRGPGAPHRPEQLPAGTLSLGAFLRRILFEIPPGRSEPGKTPAVEGVTLRLKPLPARRAKLALVEVLRDLALAEAALADGLLPLLEEFMASRGQSEQAACLVAVTRLRTVRASV